MLGEREGLAAAVVREPLPLEQARGLEGGEQLRDRRRRDGRATRELGADNLSLADRLEHQVLGDRQRRLVPCEQAFDPAADQRRRPRERLCRLAAADFGDAGAAIV